MEQMPYLQRDIKVINTCNLYAFLGRNHPSYSNLGAEILSQKNSLSIQEIFLCLLVYCDVLQDKAKQL